MACEYCMRYDGHDPRCPNYEPPKASHYCSICDEGILNGEEYVVNIDNEYLHFDCLNRMSLNGIIEWLGGEVKTMGDDYEEDY